MSLWSDVEAAAKKAAGQVIPGLSEVENAQVIQDVAKGIEGKTSTPTTSTTTSTTTSAATVAPSAGQAFLTVGLEIIAVSVFGIVADINDEIAGVIMVFMVGLWVMWAISNATSIHGLSNVITEVAGTG